MFSLIRDSESHGYEAATIETEKGSRIMIDVRNNQRLLKKDLVLTEKLWSKAKSVVPSRIGISEVVGLNELLRFYKYEVGQEFKKHMDESFIRNEREASYYTFMVYLNDDYEGGETSFDDVKIEGKGGMALVFLHSLPHEGSPVKRGTKYVMRTDIMYRLNTER